MSDAKPRSVIISKNYSSSFSSGSEENEVMSRSSSKRKSTTTAAGDDDRPEENAERNHQGSPQNEDWRAEMRSEIRAAISEMMTETARPAAITPGPFEIDEEDVIQTGNEGVIDLVKRLEAGNGSNQTAIRLAGITKEGNRQHFLDMVEIKEKLDAADAALKGSMV